MRDFLKKYVFSEFMQPSDLRFIEEGKEARFKASLERRLGCVGLLSHLLLVVGLLISPTLDREVKSYKFSFDDARTYWTMTYTFLYIPLLSICGLAIIRLWCNCLKWFDLEILMTCSFTLLVVSFPWVNGWTSAKLYGENPDEIWKKDVRAAEGNVVLTIDAIVTAVCLFIPIRMCWKWIPPVLGVLSFSVSVLAIGSPFPTYVYSNIFILTMLTIAALWGAWINEREARENFESQRVVRRLGREVALHYASNSFILDRLCDSLLHLGPDFSIIDADPRFSALLLCANKDVVAGKNFLEYLASDEDRQRFTDALQEVSKDLKDCLSRGTAATRISTHQGEPRIPAGGMVQISLRDFHGREFVVYAHHASIYDLKKGDHGHVLALVEAQEKERVSNVPHHALVPLESIADDDNDEVSSQLSDGSFVTFPVIEGRAEEIAAWVDVTSEDFPIVRCSAGFTSFGPITVGTGLANIAVKPALLRAELQTAINSFINARPDQVTPFKVRLQTSQSARVEFMAYCTIDAASSCFVQSEDQAEDSLLRLVFTNVKCLRKKTAHDRRANIQESLNAHSQGATSRYASLEVSNNSDAVNLTNGTLIAL